MAPQVVKNFPAFNGTLFSEELAIGPYPEPH